MIPYRIALRLARKSNHPDSFRHVAIVIRGGAIVATGHNHDMVHAEVAALNKLWPSERVGVRVWSIRIGRNDQVKFAKPCAKCARYLRESGVRQVFYTTSDGRWIEEKL
jgi:deoxycytidylate deaminase